MVRLTLSVLTFRSVMEDDAAIAPRLPLRGLKHNNRRTTVLAESISTFAQGETLAILGAAHRQERNAKDAYRHWRSRRRIDPDPIGGSDRARRDAA